MRVACCLALMLLIDGCYSAGTTVNVGAVLPLTGPIAQNGIYYRQGLELALDDAIKAKIVPPGHVRLIIEDCQATARVCTDALTKLVDVDRIVAAFGSTSAVTLAIQPIANREHVVLINASAISTAIEDSADYCFSVLPNADLEGAFLADYCFQSMGARRGGVLYRNDASGNSFRTSFTARFTALGGRIVYSEGHQPDLTDFGAFAAEVKSVRDLDVLFVASFWNEVASFARKKKEFALAVPIVTYETFNNPKVFEIAGDAANGVRFCAAAFNAEGASPTRERFRASFRAKYGNAPLNYYVATYYDGMSLVLQAISRGLSSGSEIQSYLRDIRVYNGVSGTMTFDANGGCSVPLAMYESREGAFLPIP